jgi:preprotein translocase subunit SecA
MENEWIRRAAKTQGGEETEHRYEDKLRLLRERYDDEVQRAQAGAREALAGVEARRGAALKQLTETHRRMFELSPYQEMRARYQQISSVELIPAVRDHDAIPVRYRRAKEELETTLLAAEGSGAASSERTALEQLRERYEEVLAAWEDRGQRSEHTARLLDQRRAEYEHGLTAMEIALLVKGGAGGNGELAELRTTYQTAEDAYGEAERQHEEHQRPLDEALRTAERRYEDDRAQYVGAVEQIREELQKAPQEYEARFRDILEKYKATCAAERDKVVAAGGLHILGTERHEARRIDNQLRGRGGRQGDPGTSRFYLSLEDDLLRIFGADRMQNLMQRLGMEEGVPIEHKLITRAIRNAQEKVEGHNFDIRKHVVEYDDVMNTQRDVIYTDRRKILEGGDVKDRIIEWVHEEIEAIINANIPTRDAEEWDLEALLAEMNAIVKLSDEFTVEALAHMSPEEIFDAFKAYADDAYEDKEEEVTSDVMRQLERLVMLRSIDSLWVEHLTAVEEMRQGIGLQAYGQQDPLVAYKREAHDMWTQLQANIRNRIVRSIYHVEIAPQTRPQPTAPPVTVATQPGVTEANGGSPQPAPARAASANDHVQRAAAQALGVKAPRNLRTNQPTESGSTTVVAAQKIGRNDPCHCGSGKKFKKCHGA